MANKKSQKGYSTLSKRKIKQVVTRYHILVIGTGGTGTCLLPNLTRLLVTNEKNRRMIRSLMIVDGDRVEEKNLARQNFLFDDIGASKSMVFAENLNEGLISEISDNTSGLFWEAKDYYITNVKQLESLFHIDKFCMVDYDGVMTLHIPFIIGCVDNNHCRMVCEQFFEKTPNCFYYDAGNEFISGEVVFAHKINEQVMSPTKSFYFPEMKTEKTKAVTEMSCEELTVSHPQTITANSGAAWFLLSGISALFANSECDLFERIQKNLGYVSFDADCHVSEFIPYRGVSGCGMIV